MSVDYITISNLIIDDIVLPDGRTFMNTLGGAGTHALVGMRLWSERVGYAATVGDDLDPAHREALERLGVDLAGISTHDGFRTPRAWQLFEPDERRIEIFRTPIEEFEQLKPYYADLPPAYRAARGIHVQWGTMAELLELIDQLRASNPEITILWEPTDSQLEAGEAAYRELLPRLDVVSPDMIEGEGITGAREPDAVAARLIEWGARLVAMRLGAEGSALFTADGAHHRIPAVPTSIVDVTGAGNAYCGGLLVGLGEGLDPVEAALRAAVSASFALEQFGAPRWDTPPHDEAERRLARAREAMGRDP